MQIFDLLHIITDSALTAFISLQPLALSENMDLEPQNDSVANSGQRPCGTDSELPTFLMPRGPKPSVKQYLDTKNAGHSIEQAAENNTIMSVSMLTGPDKHDKNANAQKICSYLDKKARMEQFFRGARLIRRHYAEWLEFIQNPEISGTHSLAYLRGKPSLVLALWLCSYCGLFSFDPSEPFTSANSQTDANVQEVPLKRHINGAFSMKVGEMWLRHGRPNTGIDGNKIQAVMQYHRDRAVYLTKIGYEFLPPEAPREISEVTSAMMLRGLLRSLSVPITLKKKGGKGSMLNYQAFLDRSAVILAMERADQMEYLDIMRELMPFCVKDIVSVFREKSICPPDLTKYVKGSAQATLLGFISPTRTPQSNIYHPKVLEALLRDHEHYRDQPSFVGPLANQVINPKGPHLPEDAAEIPEDSKARASDSKAVDCEPHSNTVASLDLWPPREPQSNPVSGHRCKRCHKRCHKRLPEVKGTTKVQDSKGRKRPRLAKDGTTVPRGIDQGSESEAVGSEPESDGRGASVSSLFMNLCSVVSNAWRSRKLCR